MNFALFVSALEQELPAATSRAERLGLSTLDAWNVLVVLQLRSTLEALARRHGCESAPLGVGRLFRGVPGFEADELAAKRERLLAVLNPTLAELPDGEPEAEVFGQLYETLLAARPEPGQKSLRKRTGSYYTPVQLTRVVAGRAFDALSRLLGPVLGERPLRVLDPALGAGAFLLQAGRELAERTGRSLRDIARHELYGVDVSPLAVAVAEASLWLLAGAPDGGLADAGRNLVEGDALCSVTAGRLLGRRGVDFGALAGEGAPGFDLVLGNPPWVAFAGRATQPLPPKLREHYRRHFQAFRGYPTLHSLFIELGARVSPRGVVALLIPSPVADLDGYRHVRRKLAESHAVAEPLLELGQDAFENVTQPCFALVAAPRTSAEPTPERAFVLSERQRSAGNAVEVQVPVVLQRLARASRLPAELFGEMGLQTNSAVTKELLYRGTTPPAEYSYALLEGRNVAEYRVGAPRLFLKPDRGFLAAARCRLRAVSEYARVKLVVRQTAAINIAAAHDGTPFRNSLLAGFELPAFPFELTLGLLNSTLYRALHLAGRRDARQGAFPQVKIAHLRALPAPPDTLDRAQLAGLARRATEHGLTPELRHELDRQVYGAFQITAPEQDQIAVFVRSLAPNAGLLVPLG
jgi:hypothetical protein